VAEHGSTVIAHQSDDAYLLNVCSTPELGHTPAIHWGWPFIFGMTLPGLSHGDAGQIAPIGRRLCTRNVPHQGIMSPLQSLPLRRKAEESKRFSDGPISR
jgi:hypothetical protein